MDAMRQKPGPKPSKKPATVEADGMARTRPRLSLTMSPKALAALTRQAKAAGLSASAYLESLVMAAEAQ